MLFSVKNFYLTLNLKTILHLKNYLTTTYILYKLWRRKVKNIVELNKAEWQ